MQSPRQQRGSGYRKLQWVTSAGVATREDQSQIVLFNVALRVRTNHRRDPVRCSRCIIDAIYGDHAYKAINTGCRSLTATVNTQFYKTV